MTERIERFSRHLTSTTTFDQRSTGSPSRCCAAQQAGAVTTLRFGRGGASTTAVHATEPPGGLITTDGTADDGSVDDANPSTLRRNRKTTANDPVADRRKLMNGRYEAEGRRLFNADRMLMTTNHSVVASWMILMTDC